MPAKIKPDFVQVVPNNGQKVLLTNGRTEDRSVCSRLREQLWTKFITYKTQREVIVQDTTIGLLHKATLLTFFLYLFTSILTDHAYMRREAPAVSTNSWNSGAAMTSRLSEYRNGTMETPWYCNNSATNYVYGPSFSYLNNQCDLSVTMGELYNEGGTSVSFVSYYQDRPLDKGAKKRNAFIPEGANVRTTIQSNQGDQKVMFEKGEVVAISLGRLLSLAGINLDDRHPNSGGARPSGNMKWPLWRMTGASITLEMDYKNFREDSPFEFSKELIVTVNPVDNVWTSRGQQIRTQRVGEKLLRFERYVQVLSVAFRPSGTLGVPDAFTGIMNVGVSAAIFGVAKLIVDTIGKWIMEEFYTMKLMGAKEWQAMSEGQNMLLRREFNSFQLSVDNE